ncbi:MAG: phosphotransferase [Bacteroidales bacterium]|nr:phosphotransferase [Bacteroidales bacterium]
MNDTAGQEVARLYAAHFGTPPTDITALPGSGSYRRYFRMPAPSGGTLIGTFNGDVRENEAFLYMTRHFGSRHLPVPALYAVSDDKRCYLQQDLGDTTLLMFLQNKGLPEGEAETVYRRVLDMLLRFQTEGVLDFDFSYCYPRPAFDTRSMMWDLNYFKYHFLKLLRVPFDEQLLEDDFDTFCAWLSQAGRTCFMYRDFQSRNVMVMPDGAVYGIDYQGGRSGPLAYDVASLLFESKTDLSPEFRERLLRYYCERLESRGWDAEAFMRTFYGFVRIRLMQAMGAYGFRGLYERKPLFIQSIPPALRTLRWLGQHAELEVRLPELERVWRFLSEMDPSAIIPPH